MYNYIALRIDCNPCDETITDLLAAFLADLDFETFEPDETGVTAYVRKDKYLRETVNNIIKDFPISTDLRITEKEIEGEDWNEEWEKNYFQPISINDMIVIRSSFHNNYPSAQIEIIIDPKMAFGTGHHATTAGMARMLLEEPLRGKSVIDMGTGTGILAILAKKLNAGATVGIDIDEFALENAKENGVLNNVDIRFLVGDDTVLKTLEPADIFLANINLNVITSNLSNYILKTKPGGKIFLSGFLKDDRDKILEVAKNNKLHLLKEIEENKWLTMVFQVES